MSDMTKVAYDAFIETMEPEAVLTPAVLAVAFGIAFSEFKDNPVVVEFFDRAEEIAEALGEELDKRLA